MKIEITPEAKEKLQAYADKTLLLDLDDGLGQYSDEGNCALVTKFRIIAVDKDADVSDYAIKLDSDLGTIYFKQSADDFLKPGIKLAVNPKTQLIVFKNDFETIDSSVVIVDFDKASA
ncbi:iron-sulfur cluster biosynthesis family protein [Companilactobacillus mishanensis]|uniref:Iron-sulfur cluster biosynthesis family protein n=1 Tax=Companilactobacillus mishanensis TaxID=2486008 RepID=A0A5P0ZHQ1_9LACO|nr:iron-sulfur cluster biosynthesis family protein [Companilactobacillus mishanensis]MQS45753.1 iron-sulfur cluster biosynthesis family protein [Companilactobacillus mishanensis]MQS52522.1 iron-sulfur cluster biosynthesis family protein [Companilactobacillus mishanensis]MQS89180.1 iron-sulfur cluster biosynthesis family protein [Companilactobacillus mishanensis]